MPRGQARQSLSPGQAQYVVNRLIAERRISPGEVARYVGEIQRDIADIEARLARLREASGGTPVGRTGAQPPMKAETGRASRTSRTRRRRTGNPLAGSYMGFMRQVTGPRKKAEFRKIKEQHGVERAIAAIKQHLGK